MLPNSILDEQEKTLAAYRDRNELAEILENYAALLRGFRRLKSDYEEERDGRERYKQLARDQERNPFVLILVDGDGYIFDDDFISGGTEGGSRAAKQLVDTVKKSLGRKGLEHCEIMVRVYADLVGLSKILNKNGLAGAEKRSLAPFTAGFNRSYGLTDFVEAGELKENADFKLKAMLRLYAENSQCKHIYLAACHDVGYISELTPYRGSGDRFTLVRSPSLLFHDEFNKLNLNIEELPGVFRTKPLSLPAGPKPSSAPSVGKLSSALTPPSPQGAMLSGDSPKICAFYASNRCKYGSGCRSAHVDNKTPSSRTSRDGASLFSSDASRAWRTFDDNRRTVSRESTGGDGKNNVQLLPTSSSIPAGKIALNSSKHRLDAYIPPPTTEIISRFKIRSDQHKLCNKKHIGGYCAEDSSCEFDHSAPPAELLPALEGLSRSMPCPRRGACRRIDCVYGHVCQKMDCRHRGGSAYCRFPYSMCLQDFTPSSYGWQNEKNYPM
ncbi:hypothetical protein B0I35DRAFT_455137 [Stachybotrys elegans]|uniref:C3H1-type domain-containing protein n=1 Tax=Stachybotrys elegans TaxID=80388 RepID=A0A8K0WK37_9HYPO|nr:hypothetical protein B0I35DRAFT_455137 [Stachybotrys elegans]